MNVSIADADNRVREAVLDRVLRDGAPVVIVDSPPGAGKTALVEAVAAVAVQVAELHVAIVTPRAAQGFDLVRRLIADYEGLPIQIFLAGQRELPEDLARDPRVQPPVRKVSDLQPGPGIVIGTAAKFLQCVPDFEPGVFDLLICDEAYQLTAQTINPLYGLAGQVLLVGDPGQLPPLVEVETTRFEVARFKVHWAAPRELISRVSGIETMQLPVSYRLPQDTVSLLQPSFYPGLPFDSAAGLDDRRIGYQVAGAGDQIDRALDLAAEGATIVGLLLPERDLPNGEVDREVAELAAEMSSRMLERGATWRERGPLTADQIGVVDPHVASGAAVRRGLRRRGLSGDELMVETPEIWQGLQRPVMIVKHPLSGQRRLSGFSLEPGRWCVMLSRHQLGCIIVGRDGIGDALAGHRHNCAARPLGAENEEWRGWEAHVRLWEELERSRRLLRVG